MLNYFEQYLFILMNRYFLKMLFLTKQYFWPYILLFYNTGIHDPFNKFNFLKSINDMCQ